MIKFVNGDLLESDAEALVNAVNTVGIMGKGIALQFKQRFPANTAAYEQACAANKVQTGRMFVTDTGDLLGARWIINFPTKQHWRGKSRLEWITAGLVDLHRTIVNLRIRSIAIPPLGAGLGGLDWAEVRPLIADSLEDLTGVRIWIYEPLASATRRNASSRD